MDYLGDIPAFWFPCGDVIDQPYNGRSNEYISMGRPGAKQIAWAVCDVGAERVAKIIPILGTPAHTGTDAELEREVWANYKNVILDDETGQPGWWHYQGVIDGLRLDVAHYTTMGSKPNTFANAANSLAADTMGDYTLSGHRPPHLAVRAHVHRHADSGDNYPTRAVILPGWQLPTPYGMQRKPTRPVDIGMIVMIVDDGQIVSEEKWIERLPRINPWSRQTSAS